MLQPKPPGFVLHTYRFSVVLPYPASFAWQWLNDPATFTETQVWPYRVEFYSPDPATIPNGFHEGVLTNHTGPMINFAGQMISVQENYRDLQYFYGSYAIRFNWIRPCRLEFWTEEKNGSTILTCAISSYVKPGIYGFWDRAQRVFWSRFKGWSRKSIKKIYTAQQK